MPCRPLHVFNYAWPHIDGYTVRSLGLISAQYRHPELEPLVAVSPFEPFARAEDRAFTLPGWGPDHQLAATRYDARGAHRPATWERPSVGLSPRTSAIFHAELDDIAQRLQPDLIHAHHPHFIGAVALQVARRRGLPLVYEIRCFNGDYDLAARHPYYRARGHWRNALELRVCRQADAVVTLSDGLAQRLEDAGIPARRLHVVRNSVPGDHFAYRGRPVDPGRPLTVGYATTFEAIEGLDTFLEGFASARRQLAAQGRELRAVLAGVWRDRDRIRGVVEHLGLAAAVDLPGFVPYGQMPELYAGLDLFVVPRRPSPVTRHTTPLKPLEALAVGVPVLASALPALRELFGDRRGVRFVEPDAEAFAAGLLAFAAEPWSVPPGVVADRAWAREVERYPEIYRGARERAAERLPSPARHAAPGPLRRFAKRALRAAAEGGMFGLEPLDRHLVICGFPRSGSTLLQLMIDSCVEGVDGFGGEVEALWAAADANRRRRFLLTKRPEDLEEIDAIRRFYRSHPGRAHFLLTVRDPRAVLTSVHRAYPGSRGYYVDPERWRRIDAAVRAESGRDDVTVVRFEDLVALPGDVERRLTERLGWSLARPFAEFHRAAEERGVERDSMTEGALGGLRPLEPERCAAWRQPRHRERLRQVLAALPELPERLIEMGYESDRRWLDDLEEEAERAPQTTEKAG